jgi:hypothetical protein
MLNEQQRQRGKAEKAQKIRNEGICAFQMTAVAFVSATLKKASQ